MKREEILKLMESAGNGGSKLNMRSEALQNRQTVRRLPMLKKTLKKKSKLLFITEIALPFNPKTGEADETFNADRKWRPPFSATTAALYLKAEAAENENLKTVLMKRAGVDSWDTSDVENFTATDWTIFAKYRVPRIFSVPVVSINIPAMTKNDFGRDYAISVKRDPMTGEIIGEVPGVLKVNKLFRDKIYEEIQEYNNKVESGELKKTEQQQKEEKSRIYQQNPVSDDHPSNWVQLIEIPLTNKYEVSADVDLENFTVDAVKDMVVLSRYSKGIADMVKDYTAGNLEVFDKNFDFFEMDMACPVDGDENSKQGKMLIGKDTKFEKPVTRFSDITHHAEIAETVREYLDKGAEIEEEVRRSIFISPYTEEVENQLFTSLETVLDIEHDKYLTQKVLLENAEVISLAFADKGIAMLEEIDGGVSDAPEGALDTEAAKEEAKVYDLGSAEFVEEINVDVDELEVE